MDERSITLALRDGCGVANARLTISSLPRKRGFSEQEDGTLALYEGVPYHYSLDGITGTVALEPRELFDPDDETARRGRLRPGQFVGRLAIVLISEGRELRTAVAVAPAKLEQSTEYRQMLDDIAEHAAEAVLQGFAPTSIDAAPSEAAAELLYQRFAVLEARLQTEDFAAAMGRVFHQPHHGWKPHTEVRSSGEGYPSGSAFGRTLAAPGPRQVWAGRRRATISTLPQHLMLERSEPTVDTLPNRFVKYALERWRDIAVQLLDTLGSTDPTAAGPLRRGRIAAEAVLQQLDELLGHGLFRQVDRLHGIPTSNQVLLKREGYRQLFRTFSLVEAGLTLAFDHSNLDDVYSPSLRNVATLYEFWCYLVLADCLGRVCGQMKTVHAFKARGDGLALTMQSGAASAIRWQLQRHERVLEVELFFNRQFSLVRGSAPDGSWSRAMRPDCSLRIRPLTALPQSAQNLDVWIHFDAKYRVENLSEQLQSKVGSEEDAQAVEAEEVESNLQTKRQDLLKMHAYRDAIHRTGGAYVLYPGNTPLCVEQFTELLPGLGAFPLRPNAERGPSGVDDLEAFLAQAIEHVSQQASRHERHRYWSSAINVAGPPSPKGIPAASFLSRPPADTEVLVGYVRSRQHRSWIERTQSYNVRADDRAGAVALGSRELSAELLLLYQQESPGTQIVALGQTGPWRAVDRHDLLRSGYPQPGGRIYFVTTFVPVPEPPAWLGSVDIEALRPQDLRWGAPFAVTWWNLIANSS